MKITEDNMVLEKNEIEYRGEMFDSNHGSPFDRGSADSWYSRPREPHWYPTGSYNGDPIESQDMSMAELRAYFAGYDYNEQHGGKKNWD
jgi:hypothetical protein